MRFLFGVILQCYVGDGFGAEDEGTIDSAYECVLFLAEIPGFTLAADKLIPPCTKVSILGAQVHIINDMIRIRNPAEKIEKIR